MPLPYRLLTTLMVLTFSVGSHAQAGNIVPIITFLLDQQDECTAGSTVIGDQILAEQADVNALRNVSTIDGDLILMPITELDFSPLNNLAEITGEFALEDNSVQTNLMGFNCLTQVGADLSIANNAVLVSFSGFDKLTRAGDDLRISHNLNLTSLPTFPELTTIVGDLEIEDNARLVSFSGFDKLTTIGDDFQIIDNPNLTSLPAFPALTMLNSRLDIENNAGLTSFSGFDKLASVADDFSIIDNARLTSLPTFPELTRMGGNLVIVRNAQLVSFSGFDKLTTVNGSLSITLNPKLINMPTFLTDVTSDLLFLDRNILSDITSIQALAHRTVALPFFDISENCLDTTKVPTRGILAGIDANNGLETFNDNANPRTTGCPSPLPAQANSVSEFDLDASSFDASEGWTITGNGTSTTPDHEATGGQSGGFIKDVDGPTGILWYFKAPIQYYGDASDYKDGSLSYYVKQLTGTTPFIGDDIIIQGGGVTLTHRFDDPNPSSSEWTQYTVPLSANAWNVGLNGTTPATDAQMDAVLGDLSSLEIRGEYISGPDSAGLDSVVMKKP